MIALELSIEVRIINVDPDDISQSNKLVIEGSNIVESFTKFFKGKI